MKCDKILGDIACFMNLPYKQNVHYNISPLKKEMKI